MEEMASNQKEVSTVAEFREIVSRSIPLDSPEIAADFSSISPDDVFALFKFVWNLKIVQHLEFVPKTKRKNDELAEKWRQMGNECFRFFPIDQIAEFGFLKELIVYSSKRWLRC